MSRYRPKTDLDELESETPGAILYTGGECPSNLRGFWPFNWYGKHELVLDKALGKVVWGQKRVRTLLVKCKHCGACVAFCPHGVLELEEVED